MHVYMYGYVYVCIHIQCNMMQCLCMHMRRAIESFMAAEGPWGAKACADCTALAPVYRLLRHEENQGAGTFRARSCACATCKCEHQGAGTSCVKFPSCLHTCNYGRGWERHTQALLAPRFDLQKLSWITPLLASDL